MPMLHFSSDRHTQSQTRLVSQYWPEHATEQQCRDSLRWGPQPSSPQVVREGTKKANKIKQVLQQGIENQGWFVRSFTEVHSVPRACEAVELLCPRQLKQACDRLAARLLPAMSPMIDLSFEVGISYSSRGGGGGTGKSSSRWWSVATFCI